jgi:hypothetical protein
VIPTSRKSRLPGISPSAQALDPDSVAAITDFGTGIGLVHVDMEKGDS